MNCQSPTAWRIDFGTLSHDLIRCIGFGLALLFSSNPIGDAHSQSEETW